MFQVEKVFLGNYGTINLRKGNCDVVTFNQIFLDKEYDIDFGFTPYVIVDCRSSSFNKR